WWKSTPRVPKPLFSRMPASSLHILFLVSWYPNRNAPVLGNFIRRHAEAAALRHKISVVYACSGENVAEGKTEVQLSSAGNLTECIVYYGKVRSTTPVIAQVKKRSVYREAMKEGIRLVREKNGRADILHVHVIWPAVHAALPLLEETDIPLVISEHWSGYLPEDGNYRGVLLKFFSTKLAEKARHITVVSSRMKDAMLAHGFRNSFSILPNCADETVFFPAEKKENGKIKLLHVSMLVDREKNVSGMLRAMKRFEKNHDISLHIIGDGPERQTHEETARRLSLLQKNVFFHGLKNSAEIAQEMRTSDALLLFSHFEGMPVTIIEAQLCGLPVIATKTGAIPDMVRSTEGMLVDPADEEQLFNAILSFAAKKNDYDRAAISRRAMENYSVDAVSRHLDSIYQNVMTHGGA
ncbi:MAG TPA: glycosyltransferase, partial [Bacteroidia bacterium]|nr:glycosyltransferase [Bacteroidia bacterium]